MSNSDAFSGAFDHTTTEGSIRTFWEQHQFYRSTPQPGKTPFVIVMPPPNITGDLTMGHMLYTLQDILIRWHRGLGKEACWIPGTDHASIATEAKVTKMLQEQGISKHEIGREAFLEHAHQWKDKFGGRIVDSLKNLGVSCDWDRNVFTMDPGYSAGVIKALVQLYKDGLVYKSHRLVNWCPVSQSVISDEEVNPEQRSGSMWHIRYPLADDATQYVVVATTRPETLFGDLALAIHPQDPRAQHLVGKQVRIPVADRLIPIIADEYVDPQFGTGVVKITPAHDPNDFEVGKRHKLGLLNVMNPDASLNGSVPADYQGLDRFVARKKLVAHIQSLDLLEKIAPHNLVIGISERGNTPIEYYLSEQWYIKMGPLAEKALACTRSKALKLIPAYQEKVWEHWLTNIQDWCISRQLWWGHRLPFYTCQACGHITCSEQTPQQCTACPSTDLKQDEDVLDTWASSWIWPFGVHNWGDPHASAQQQQDLAYYYPTDVLITGADIIFFWVARMAMAGMHFLNQVPFKTCYFTPIVRDAQGRKMSKSLGNSPDITQIIKTYGTDAMRFSLVNQIAPGQDIFWKDESCELGKNFANKIWNSARFLLLHAQKQGLVPASCHSQDLAPQTDPLLSWIVSEFFAVVDKAHQSMEKLEFSQYTSALYEFVWMVYCDWFLELLKPRLTQESHTDLARQSLAVGLQVFDGVLRLLHPVMPFITEQVWQHAFAQQDNTTIGHQPIPLPTPLLIQRQAIVSMRAVQDVVGAVRTIRGQFQIHPATQLTVFVNASAAQFGELVPYMTILAKADFHWNAQADAGFCAPALAGSIPLFIRLEGLVDPAAESRRLQEKLTKIEGVLVGLQHKLSNTAFVTGAPAHIVAGAKAQQEQATAERQLLQDALNTLQGAARTTV